MEHVDDVLLLNHFTHAADGTEGATASPAVPGSRREGVKVELGRLRGGEHTQLPPHGHWGRSLM